MVKLLMNAVAPKKVAVNIKKIRINYDFFDSKKTFK